MASDEKVLVLKDITKTYPGVTALNCITLELEKGEIHALIGENGAGKSTLIKTCTGAVIPDSGEISVGGMSYSKMSPNLASANGIAVIYQEFNLVGELSVAENIFLGHAVRKGIVIDRKSMENESADIFKRLNIDINPNELVKNLTVGYQQIVEIAKAVSMNAKILIMDEPSAPLTNTEVECMFTLVDKLKEAGVTIVYISHRLDEIFRLSDRITILRDGEYVDTLITRKSNVDELVRLMVGRELKETFPSGGTASSQQVLLEAKEVTGNGVKNIHFKLRKGEILGLAGLIGSGRTELAELIFGVKKIESGELIFKGEKLTMNSPQHAIKKGIALVPEDRKKQGALLSMTVRENIIMASVRRISKASVINTRKELEIGKSYEESLRIKTPSLEQLIRNLSGGNQQKVILAKWLATDPELIIFDEPTRGIDVGAKHEIYKIMRDLVTRGKTIIMISSEMEELIGMSDRILVLSEGCITGELLKEEFTQEKIMTLASKICNHSMK